MPSGTPHSDATLDRIVGMYGAAASLRSIAAAAGIRYETLRTILVRLRNEGRIVQRKQGHPMPAAPRRPIADGMPCRVCGDPTTPQPVPWGACVTRGSLICTEPRSS